MRIELVNGLRATDRAGAAELLATPLSTVRQYSKPSQRKKRGWPEPIEGGPAGGPWFPIDALEQLRENLRPAPLVPEETDADPSDLLSAEEFATLRGVEHATLLHYVETSKADWGRHQDGLLPLPDRSEPARHGTRYFWRRERALAWTHPSQPRRSTGRPRGPRPTVGDLEAILTQPGGDQLTEREVAQILTHSYGSADQPVSLQTVRRLKQKLRSA